MWRGRHSLLLNNRPFLAVFISLLLFNVCEALLFTLDLSHGSAISIVVAYHIFGLFSLYSILGITLFITRQKFPAFWLFTIASAISVFIAIPGLAIEGVQSIGYSLTRIPGPFYPVIQIALAVPAIGVMVLLSLGSFDKSKEVRNKSIVLLACLTAPFICLTVVIILMQIGIHINATIIVSSSINVFLFGLLYIEGKYHIYGLLSTVPGTPYNESARALARALFDPNIPLEKAKEMMDIEKTKYTLKLTKGNQSEAARILGVSRPTICRRIKSLK